MLRRVWHYEKKKRNFDFFFCKFEKIFFKGDVEKKTIIRAKKKKKLVLIPSRGPVYVFVIKLAFKGKGIKIQY